MKSSENSVPKLHLGGDPIVIYYAQAIGGQKDVAAENMESNQRREFSPEPYASDEWRVAVVTCA